MFEAVKIQNPLHKKLKMSDFVNLVINTRFLLLVIEAELGGKRPRRGHYAAMPCGGLSRCYDFLLRSCRSSPSETVPNEYGHTRGRCCARWHSMIRASLSNPSCFFLACVRSRSSFCEPQEKAKRCLVYLCVFMYVCMYV